MTPRKKKKATKRAKATRKPRAKKAQKEVLENVDSKFMNAAPSVTATPERYLLSWMAPEFAYHKKPIWWNWVAYGSLVGLTGLMLFLGEWFGAIVFVLIGVLIYQYAEVKPKNVEISLTTVGVNIGDKFYPYNNIKSFWVIYDPPVKTLNLELTKRFAPILNIQLEETDPVVVKDTLGSYIHEESERTEDVLEKFIRLLKF